MRSFSSDENPGLAIAPLAFVYSTAEHVRDQLQALARSTAIHVDERKRRLFLCGTNLDHHSADPSLYQFADTLPVSVRKDQFGIFYTHLPCYDLCLEDSWTGYFLSSCLQHSLSRDPIVLIHLDDHTDMMSTLLVQHQDGLYDPGSDRFFNPGHPNDWRFAITGGAIGIGSFVTALYYLENPLHVIHLNHINTTCGHSQWVNKSSKSHAFLPDIQFADIEKTERNSPNALGTYISGKVASNLLEEIPNGRVFVHIDLDYFINDYNGNVGASPPKSEVELRKDAEYLMAAFFESLSVSGRPIERWMIATSPGFCSSKHWGWLLDRLQHEIRKVESGLSKYV